MTELAVRERPSEPASRELSLVERAIEAGVSIEQLQAIVAMQERMEARRAEIDFREAKARMQASLPPFPKTKTVLNKDGKTTRYKHEVLADIIEIARPCLAREGFSYEWKFRQDGRELFVTFILSRGGHSEETTISGITEAPIGANAVQGVGATATFLQRYTFKAGIGAAAAEEDTDGVPPRDEGERPPSINADRVEPFMMRIDNAAGHEELRPIYAQAKRDLKGADFDAVAAAVRERKAEIEGAVSD